MMRTKEPEKGAPVWSEQIGKEKIAERIRRYRNNIQCACERTKYGYCYKDLWDVSSWFLHVMPAMLDDIACRSCGCPVEFSEKYALTGDEASEKWKETLQEMSRLFRDACEDTCSRKNPQEEEFRKVWEEFVKKYGMLGDGLLTEEDLQKGRPAVYLPEDAEEYREFFNRYYLTEEELKDYRRKCLEKGFAMFLEWFTILGI